MQAVAQWVNAALRCLRDWRKIVTHRPRSLVAVANSTLVHPELSLDSSKVFPFFIDHPREAGKVGYRPPDTCMKTAAESSQTGMFLLE